MATTRPFAYNPSQTPIDGTEQLGDLAIGQINQDYSVNPGGVDFWMGPEENLGYVITIPVPSGDQPTPVGTLSFVGFFRSEFLTENSFLELTNNQFNQNFIDGNSAVTWLNLQGYWTSFVPVPVTPTMTPSNTPTRTSTPTPTPTVTPSNTPYPPNTYFFYLPEGVSPQQPTLNGNLMFTTNGGTEVGYNPNTTDEVVIYLTDKSGLYHPSYLDVATYGGVITMTQGSNTVILSADTGQWSTYGTYISGNYLEVVESSPNPFVSGSPINLVLTVNYPPTPTPTVTTTSTNTPTPTNTTTPTPSNVGFIVTGGTGTAVAYTPGSYFNAFTSASGVTTTDAFNSNNGCWQLYYSHSAVTISSGSNRIGLNSSASGSNSWSWSVAISNSNNTIGNWGTVSAITTVQSFSYLAGGFNQSNTTQTVTIPANRYFLIMNNGGPFFRTIKT